MNSQVPQLQAGLQMRRPDVNEYELGHLAEGSRHTGWPGTQTSRLERRVSEETVRCHSPAWVSNPWTRV